jgi:hypothetical protein
MILQFQDITYLHQKYKRGTWHLHKNLTLSIQSLMTFDFYHTWVQVVWVIMSQQTCEDMVEWLGALWTKLLSHMPHWRPSYFIVDDAPQ